MLGCSPSAAGDCDGPRRLALNIPRDTKHTPGRGCCVQDPGSSKRCLERRYLFVCEFAPLVSDKGSPSM
jgi:hypothetical protein